MSIEWKDATSYSQGERGKRPPSSWECEIAGFRVWISSRHVAYPDSWVMTCRDMGLDVHYLGESEGVPAEQAQKQAINFAAKIAQGRVNKMLAFISLVVPKPI